MVTPRKDPKDYKKQGRPTKYHPKLAKDIVKFFSRPLYVKKEVVKNVNGSVIKSKEMVPNETPYLIDWVIKHDLDVDTPADWAKKIPEFSRAFYRCKKLQEKFLAELGIKGDHNGFMTNQALKNICGWRDKTEVEHSGELKFNRLPPITVGGKEVKV